jgi:hypothetical protein
LAEHSLIHSAMQHFFTLPITKKIPLTSLVCLLLMQCNPAQKRAVDLQNLDYTVEEAHDWNALFLRKSGWLGADGIFAIPLDGKDNDNATKQSENLLIFSDTVIGEITDSTLHEGAEIVNNTVAYLKGSEPKADDVDFQWTKNSIQKPAPLFVPKTLHAKPADYYWLGDGFLNTENDSIYIFGHRMRNLDTTEAWSFKEMATDLIALGRSSRPPFTDQRQIETPLGLQENSFGAGIFTNTKSSGAKNADGYIYVYGNRKGLIVGRVKPEAFENFQTWQYWDGKDWKADMAQAKTVADSVSNELSVSALPDGRYVLIFTLGGMGPTVGMRLGETPYGPFGPVIKLYEGKEMQRKNHIIYNAKAHPSLSAPGELLISYNVNAFDFWNELKASPNLYRPRFIRLKFK